MSTKPVSPIRKAWYKWKSLHLPWRKRFLIGLDLQGNTFWEFRDTLNSHKNRMRRIVQYPPRTHLSDVKVSPQWHQWLRHTRAEAPSLEEQRGDVLRREELKVLVARADARWRAVPSVGDGVGRGGLPVLGEVRGGGGRRVVDGERGLGRGEEVGESVKEQEQVQGEETPKMQVPDGEKHSFNERPDGTRVEFKGKKHKEDPWKKARGAPSEDWQPKGWDPNVAATKR